MMSLEDQVRQYFQDGLVDQRSGWFDSGGDVSRTAMAEDAIDTFGLDASENAPVCIHAVWQWAYEATEWWNGLGIEYRA